MDLSNLAKRIQGQFGKKKNNAYIYSKKNYKIIINNKKNIFIDDFFNNLNEEILYHISNHCCNNDLRILLSTDRFISNYQFQLDDLSSRLKSFHFIQIKQPDDDLIVNLIIKLLFDKQVIINNPEIFSYLLKRINRTYKDIYFFVEKIDKLSLQKKRELTVPLIRELL